MWSRSQCSSHRESKSCACALSWTTVPIVVISRHGIACSFARGGRGGEVDIHRDIDVEVVDDTDRRIVYIE